MKHKKNCPSCPEALHNSLKRIGEKVDKYDYTIALAGNPNTGKSTVFNTLTGLKQHTGNWPGKTVTRAEGAFEYMNASYRLVDLPGTYSLLSTSEDEEVARGFILFGCPDVTVIVADATRLERNLNLTLQILEITDKAVLCVNLLDEAKRNGVNINLQALGRRLGIPVVGCSARSGIGIGELLAAVKAIAEGSIVCRPRKINSIPLSLKNKVDELEHNLLELYPSLNNARWLAFRLMESDQDVIEHLQDGSWTKQAIAQVQQEEIEALINLAQIPIPELKDGLHDTLSEALYAEAAQIATDVVTYSYEGCRAPLDVKIDRIVTSRIWGFPIMLMMLAGVLWLTIVGSNYPSSLLSDLLVGIIHPFLQGLGQSMGLPWWLSGFLFDGVYLATAWVVSVMLPPMAIFFPLFTLLEDFGYLPRVAFNLDELFRKAGAHGKQALTMSMGFGCNAAGVVSSRIIDSPRERLIAIITNNFSLCNGRWPTQILIASIFLGATVPSYLRGIVSVSAVILIALLGLAFMFFASWGLSRTLLKGHVSTFNLELPPYRPPQFWRTFYTSLIDRTLIVLWRAIVFAAPAGAIIWLTCNAHIEGQSIAVWLIHGLDGFGWILGLNGVILLAYILAIPANEIVIPTILMLTVLTTGNATEIAPGAGVMFDDATLIPSLLHSGGWTLLTGVSLMLFCLLHNPCSTTIYTIYRETKSLKWTAVSVFLPLLTGIIVCTLVAAIWRLAA